MNHRTLFFLSITVIAVGVTGIFIQRNQTTSNTPVVNVISNDKKMITIAEATRELKPFDVLEARDYIIKTTEVAKEESDARDLSSLSSMNLNGYLVRNNIAKGSAIIPSLIESPTSKTFIMHSLRGDELPYGYTVKPREEYLLSSLNVGDKVSLFIRVAEVEKGKKSDVNYVEEGRQSSGKTLKKYALSPVLGGLTILEVQREKKEEKGYAKDAETPVGKLVLRMNQHQLAELRVVEKAGEIILFPAEGGQSNKKIAMDDVLPQFRAIKELRGGK